jgi:hypothetical protein
MAVKQSLTVSELSFDEVANTSRVRILWKSTQTGESRNEYTRTAYYYVSINGSEPVRYSVSYKLPRNTVRTVANVTLTVPHNADGTGSVKVTTWMNTQISAGVVELEDSVTLTPIKRASDISFASDVTLGEEGLLLKWTPLSASMTYRVMMALGEWSQTSGVIAPPSTAEYSWSSPSLDISLARYITTSTEGSLLVKLYSYSDAAGEVLVGENSVTVTATVPDTIDTLPTISVTLSPQSSLPEALAARYVQGLSAVRAICTAEGKYGASIVKYTLNVDGVSYTSEEGELVSDVIKNRGWMYVECAAVDSRGHSVGRVQRISVLGYTRPRVVPVGSESEIVCARCNEEGALSPTGAYLMIRAAREYNVMREGIIQRNYCTLRYRYRSEGEESFSAWRTLLPPDVLDTNDYVSPPMSGIVPSVSTVYVVQIGVVDSVGESAATAEEFIIPTDEVAIDVPKKYKGRRIGIGGYAKDTDEPGIDMGAPVYGGALDSLKAGGEIEAGADIDEYITPGVWSSPSAEVSAGLLHSPTDKSGFRLEVREMETTSAIRQTAFYSSAIAVRSLLAGEWSEWQYFLSVNTSEWDAIEKSGVDGVWHYEKMLSGRVKLWGNISATHVSDSTVEGSATYPVALGAVHSCVYSIMSCTDDVGKIKPTVVLENNALRVSFIDSTQPFDAESAAQVSVFVIGTANTV